MRIKLMFFCGLSFLFLRNQPLLAKSIASASDGLTPCIQVDGGGDDKEKKKEKGGKKEKDESTKDAKTQDLSAKPQQHARLSAKTAKQSSKLTQKEVMGRAKVRNFFHSTFNTKYGRPVNFRSTPARNRWSKGHKW